MKKYLILFVMYLSFISLGLPDQAIGVAWPEMRAYFGQSVDKLGFLIMLSTLFSAVAGYFSGYVLSRFRVGKILIYSNLLIIIGFLGYTLSPSWTFVLIAAVPFGLGGGAIDVVLNNYAAKNLSSKQVSWLHGFWGVGASLGPIIMTITYAFEWQWKIGFLIIVAVQSLLLIFFIVNRDIWNKTTETKTETEVKQSVFGTDTILSSLFFAIYVALEGSIGVWYVSYLVDYKSVSEVYAGFLISLYFGVFTCGRFLVGFLTEKMTDKSIITYSILTSFLCLILLYFDIYEAVALVGLTLAGLYPCMVNMTHKRFKTRVAEVLMGWQVSAACLGFAFLIPLVGFVLEKMGLQLLPIILIGMAILLFLIDIRLRKLSK